MKKKRRGYKEISESECMMTGIHEVYPGSSKSKPKELRIGSNRKEK